MLKDSEYKSQMGESVYHNSKSVAKTKQKTSVKPCQLPFTNGKEIF